MANPRIVPLNTPIGAQIHGLDVAAGIDDAGYRLVREALDEHSVVIMRDQEVSPANQRKLAAAIGTLRPLVYSQYSLPDFPEVMIVSNIVENGRNIGIADAGSLWHSDGAYLAQPDMYSLLYGIDIPQRGGKALGDTAFTGTWKAYEALPQDIKSRLAGRRCINSFSWHLEKKARLGQLKRAPQTPEQKAATPDVEQPVVRRHPHTGRPCLFVAEAHTTEIIGMPKDESDALLEFLWEHLKSEKFHYRHSWRKGDLVIWDNCAVQHLAHFDYGDLPRRLHRTGTFGPAPVSF
jgi:taurine dioxygenase